MLNYFTCPRDLCKGRCRIFIQAGFEIEVQIERSERSSHFHRTTLLHTASPHFAPRVLKRHNASSSRPSSMDFTASSGGWIHARLSGSAVDSTDVEQPIREHSTHGEFTWTFASAVGGASTNPLPGQYAHVQYDHHVGQRWGKLQC